MSSSCTWSMKALPSHSLWRTKELHPHRRSIASAAARSPAFAPTRPLFALEKMERAQHWNFTKFRPSVPRVGSSASYSGSTTYGLDSQADVGAVNSTNVLRSLPFLKTMEALYFRADSWSASSTGNEEARFCRLCQHDLDADESPNTHILSPNKSSHVHHGTREVVLDTMALFCARGYNIDEMFWVWSHVLFNKDTFPRLPNLSSPSWSIERRAEALRSILRGLQEDGLIHISTSLCQSISSSANLSPYMTQKAHRQRVAFERLEYIGDSAWGTHMSSRMMTLFPDHQWQYSEDFSRFNFYRDCLEMNITLELCFDKLQIEQLFTAAERMVLRNGKIKADIVEALLGELHVCVWGFMPQLDDEAQFVEPNALLEAPLCSLIQHCLTELYDLIVLCHLQDMIGTALPLAKEIASRHVWREVKPALRSGRVKRQRSSSAVALEPKIALDELGPSPSASKTSFADAASFSTMRTCHVLPALCTVSNRPCGRTPFAPPAFDVNDVAHKSFIRSATRCSHTGADVFAELINSYHEVKPSSSPVNRRVSDSNLLDAFELLVDSLSGQTDVPTAAANLQTEPSLCTSATIMFDDSSLHYAVANVLPPLSAAPTEPAEAECDSQNSNLETAFAASRFILRGIKPPSSGIITDTNLYAGKFAFLDPKLCDVPQSNELPQTRNVDSSDREVHHGDPSTEVSGAEFHQMWRRQYHKLLPECSKFFQTSFSASSSRT